MGLLDKVKGVLSHESGEERGRDHTPHIPFHLNPAHEGEPAERSSSRGRFMGTGRGGAGNMSHSQVRGGESGETAEDIATARSRSRSRTRAARHGVDPPIAAGRGGAGNVRSVSNDLEARVRAAKLDEEEIAVGQKYEKLHEGDEYTSGRGGFGNVPHKHAEGGKQ